MNTAKDRHGNILRVGDRVRPSPNYSWWQEHASDRTGVIKGIGEYGISVLHDCRDGALTWWGGVESSDPGIELVSSAKVLPKGAQEIDERFARRAAEREKKFTQADLDTAYDDGFNRGYNQAMSDCSWEGYR